VRRRIETGDPSWEAMVPPVVADMIKAKNLFGYPTADDGKRLAR